MAGIARTSRAVWAGRIISGLVAVVLLADGAVALLAPEVTRAQMQETGFAAHLGTGIGLLAIIGAALYAFPRTAVIGAIVITGFLGGAICTHYRIGEIGSPPQIMALVLGILAWGGLYLRQPRLRELLPLVA